MAQGWEGYCIGLQLLNRTTTKDECRDVCCADPDCEVWQWATKRSERDVALAQSAMSCHVGKGFECRSVRTDDFLVYAGQRISHGTKLEDGMWCTGNGMRHVPYSSKLSHADRLQKCSNACFHNKECHVWQYSTLKGCWSGFPNYGSFKCYKDVALAGTIMDGQRFDRSCEPQGAPKTNYMLVFLVILSAAFLLLCFSVVVLFFGLCGRKSAGGTSNGPKSSRQDSAELSGDELENLGEDGTSRSAQQGGAYRALYPPSASTPPISENGSMSNPWQGAAVGQPPLRPVDASFGGSSSGSSFGQGTTPLLPPYPGQLPMTAGQGNAAGGGYPLQYMDPRVAPQR